MASSKSLSRFGSTLIRKTLFYSSSRSTSSSLIERAIRKKQQQLRKEDEEIGSGILADVYDLDPSIPKYEYLQGLRGLKDPYQLTVHALEDYDATSSAPELITSTQSTRMVGCLCDEDAESIKWTKLTLGEKQKCECGKWFQLVPANISSL